MKTNSFSNKIKIDHFDSDHFIAQDNHFDNNKHGGQIWCNDMNNSDDQSYDELDSL